jgi:hypothetical protein
LNCYSYAGRPRRAAAPSLLSTRDEDPNMKLRPLLMLLAGVPAAGCRGPDAPTTSSRLLAPPSNLEPCYPLYNDTLGTLSCLASTCTSSCEKTAVYDPGSEYWYEYCEACPGDSTLCRGVLQHQEESWFECQPIQCSKRCALVGLGPGKYGCSCE